MVATSSTLTVFRGGYLLAVKAVIPVKAHPSRCVGAKRIISLPIKLRLISGVFAQTAVEDVESYPRLTDRICVHTERFGVSTSTHFPLIEFQNLTHPNLQKPFSYISVVSFVAITTTPTMSPTRTLPREIWGMIASEADPDDLANLRLTSKDLCAAATRPFGLSRLAHRRFIVSPYSLHGLFQLTAHPVLAKYMKSISLGTYGIHDNVEPSRVEPGGTNTNEDVLAASITQYQFERQGDSACDQMQAFTNLKHRKLRIDIGIHDDVGENRRELTYDFDPNYAQWTPVVRHIARRAYGFDQIYGRLDLCRVGRREADGTLLDLHYALAQSTYCFSALFIDFDKAFFERDEGAWGAVLDPLVEALVFPDGHTTPARNLTIRLCAERAEDDSVLKLGSDRSLHVVRHGINDIPPDRTPDLCTRPYGLFTRVLHGDHFETMVLKHISSDHGLSEVFLRNYPSTLRHLELQNMYFWSPKDDPTSDTLNVWMALEEISGLEVLVLEDSTFGNDSGSVKFRGKVVLRGGEIRVGLRQLIDKTGECLRISAEEKAYFDITRIAGPWLDHKRPST